MDNAQRADRAQTTLEEYRRLIEVDEDEDMETVCIDLLTDFLHLFKQQGWRHPMDLMKGSVKMAEMHFEEERGGR